MESTCEKINISFKKISSFYSQKIRLFYMRANNKSLKFDIWKGKFHAIIKHNINQYFLSYSDAWFAYRKKVAENFSVVKTEKNQPSIKSKIRYVITFAISCIIFYLIDQKFNLIELYAINYIAKKFWFILYCFLGRIYIDGFFKCMQNFVNNKFLLHPICLLYIFYQLIKSSIVAAFSYTLILVAIYNLYQKFQLIITKVKKAISFPELRFVRVIILDYSGVKVVIYYIIALGFMFIMYRLYVPILKATCEILEFNLNYKHRYDYSKYSVHMIFKMFIAFITLVGSIKLSSTDDSDFKKGVYIIIIGYFIHIFCNLIIEYKIEKNTINSEN